MDKKYETQESINFNALIFGFFVVFFINNFNP